MEFTFVSKNRFTLHRRNFKAKLAWNIWKLSKFKCGHWNYFCNDMWSPNELEVNTSTKLKNISPQRFDDYCRFSQSQKNI